MVDVTVTHPDRVVFPDIGLTKGELVEHYRRVAPNAVPHLRGRPRRCGTAFGAMRR